MGKCQYCDETASIEVLDDDDMIMVCEYHDPNKEVGSKSPDSKELRCTNCNSVINKNDIVNDGEYAAPVSKCCTAYIKEFDIFICGTMKV